jgi:flagellar hook-basal body complex protein FliE
VQLSACDAVIQSKNDLIAQIKKDLKTKDNEFAKVLKQQSEDIDTLLKHMSDQTKTMAEACRCGVILQLCTQHTASHIVLCSTMHIDQLVLDMEICAYWSV